MIQLLDDASVGDPIVDGLRREAEERLASICRLEEEANALVQLLRQHTLEVLQPRPATWQHRFRHQLKRLVGVKLGMLQDHPPRPLCIPARYYRDRAPADCPTISIVTPSFNQARFLERTLRSVLDQRYPRLEYLVQDGGSKDDSRDILRKYQTRLTHWESTRDRGQAHAVNLGFARASGEVMAYLNSDDVLLPGSLHYVGRFFAEHPEVDVVYGHRVIIDGDDRVTTRWVLPPHDDQVLTWADYVPQETLFWRRSLWQRAGAAMDESFAFALDWDLILRFRAVGARFARLPRFLGAFRLHALQKTLSQLNTVGEREMRRLRQRCHGRDVSPGEIRRGISRYLLRHAVYHRLYQIGVLRY